MNKQVSLFLPVCWVWHAAAAVAPLLCAEHPTEPRADLAPAEVVAAQLYALKNNDSANRDDGIRTAFRFASPGNRRVTGPIERFIEMVKNPLYAPLLNHRSARSGEMTVVGGAARQKVTLTARDGAPATYVFILTQQDGPPCSGCWMTDAVIRSENHLPAPRIAAVGRTTEISPCAPRCRSGARDPGL